MQEVHEVRLSPAAEPGEHARVAPDLRPGLETGCECWFVEIIRRRRPKLIQAVEHRAIADELMDEPNKGLFSEGNEA